MIICLLARKSDKDGLSNQRTCRVSNLSNILDFHSTWTDSLFTAICGIPGKAFALRPWSCKLWKLKVALLQAVLQHTRSGFLCNTSRIMFFLPCLHMPLHTIARHIRRRRTGQHCDPRPVTGRHTPKLGSRVLRCEAVLSQKAGGDQDRPSQFWRGMCFEDVAGSSGPKWKD